MNNEYNARLQNWNNRIPNQFAGKGNIEVPGSYTNIIWQNRDAVPNQFQMALSHELQEAYEKTAGTPQHLVDHLNQVGVYDENGQSWTVESLSHYLSKVGY